MLTIDLSNIVSATVPSNGWKVKYRIKGTTGAYTIPNGSPYMAQPIIFTTTDANGTLYEGTIQSDCGTTQGTEFVWVTGCNCDTGYTLSNDGNICYKIMTTAATLVAPVFCLAPAYNFTQYSIYQSRIYNYPFVNSALNVAPLTSDPNVLADLTVQPQWKNVGSFPATGPMNRSGVWIDSNCDGNADALTAGQQTTLAYSYNNTGLARMVYVGIGADNEFLLRVNGVLIADSAAVTGSNPTYPFRIWHIIPVMIPVGNSYFNLIATGDGTVQDAMAFVIYDNTAAQLQSATDDAQLNILFNSGTLRNTSYEIANCSDLSYSLDTSAGVGNYICKKTVTVACNTVQPLYFYYSYEDVGTDPYINSTTAPTMTSGRTVAVALTNGANLLLSLPQAAQGKNLVIKVPKSQGSFGTWIFGNIGQTPDQSGTIPDNVFRGSYSTNNEMLISVGDFNYIINRNTNVGVTFDYTKSIQFNH